jgi:hypothetical protein
MSSEDEEPAAYMMRTTTMDPEHSRGTQRTEMKQRNRKKTEISRLDERRALQRRTQQHHHRSRRLGTEGDGGEQRWGGEAYEIRAPRRRRPRRSFAAAPHDHESQCRTEPTHRMQHCLPKEPLVTSLLHPLPLVFLLFEPLAQGFLSPCEAQRPEYASPS